MKIVTRIIFFVSFLALLPAPLFAQTKQSTDTFTQASRTVIELARKALDDHTIHLEMNGDDDPFFSIHLGNYYAYSISQLKQKLSTMPKGTHFLWHPLAVAGEGDARQFREIKSFLAENGMTLERSEK